MILLINISARVPVAAKAPPLRVLQWDQMGSEAPQLATEETRQFFLRFFFFLETKYVVRSILICPFFFVVFIGTIKVAFAKGYRMTRLMPLKLCMVCVMSPIEVILFSGFML